ncbi:MAG: hypothetical protein PUF50_03075 [Erysipelotrichaceae bacterium]|nr:hypothetical protein [Erysipelotrichaceae bacterium]
MKKAKEMFEELGYQLEENTGFNDWIVYVDNRTYYIEFDLVYKRVNISLYAIIDSKMIKAITKQMEELGWLDE